MNIVHIGLASYFTEGMNYQDNMLSEANQKAGHCTTYISNASCFINGRIADVESCDKILDNGVRLIRLRYRSLGLPILTEKIRVVKGLYGLLEQLQPDIILSHDLCYWSVLDVIRYKKSNPTIVLYADTHTDANNSGTNWASLNVLHRGFYRYLAQKALPHIKKYFYVSKECKNFSNRIYGIPESIMEFYPLGGEIVPAEKREADNEKIRDRHGLSEENILFVHSGKMDALKRTAELLQAFSSVSDDRFRLFLIGSIPEDIRMVLDPMIQADKRVSFLGWKSGEELQEYLCACDLYLQPGSQSATMQVATCCGAPTMLYPHESHYDYDKGNIFFVKTVVDMKQVFLSVSNNPQQLKAMEKAAIQLAEQMLDYDKLAGRICI